MRMAYLIVGILFALTAIGIPDKNKNKLVYAILGCAFLIGAAIMG